MATKSQVPRGISPEKARAYQATEFVVLLDSGPLVLKVNSTSARLSVLLARYGAASAAFITAFNPHGGDPPVSPEENKNRQDALIQEARVHWMVIPGEGRDPTGEWPAEPSLLVVGISLEGARSISSRYSQDAFVYGDAGGYVRLVATDPTIQGTLDSVTD